MVTVNSKPGEMIRVLALIERRRFTIHDLQVDDGDLPGTRAIGLSVASSGRSVDSLVQQLRKLIDVVDVQHVQDR